MAGAMTMGAYGPFDDADPLETDPYAEMGMPPSVYGDIYGGFRYPVIDVTPRPRRAVYSFSTTELKQLGIAVAVMTLAFAIFFSGGLWGLSPLRMALFIPITLVTAIPGFILHEMAHKFVAQRYGNWAEFRASYTGLAIALFASFMGFIWAAPGAVMIAGYVDRVQNGRISVAGAVVNAVLGYLFFVPALILWFTQLRSIGFGIPYHVCYLGALVNLFLGAFNLLPIGFLNLDGAKVWRWSKAVWIGMYIVILPGLLFTFLFL